MSDILWRDNSGDVAIWLMNGVQLLPQSGGVSTVPSSWTVVGQRDFNGDGNNDILWQDNSGNVAIWLMNGAQITPSAGVANVSSAWTIQGTGDFNADGHGDILWRDNSGNVSVWLMNGTQITQSVGIANVSSTWTNAQSDEQYLDRQLIGIHRNAVIGKIVIHVRVVTRIESVASRSERSSRCTGIKRQRWQGEHMPLHFETTCPDNKSTAPIQGSGPRPASMIYRRAVSRMPHLIHPIRVSS